MTYDFETKGSRLHSGNAKYLGLPEYIRDKGIISFAGSEPEYKTAPSVIRAIVERAENGLMDYTIADSESYYEPIIWWLRTQRGAEVRPEWIVPTLGMSFSFNTCVKAFTDEGDGVIIQPPTFSHYQMSAENQGRHVVFNDLIEDNGHYSMDFGGLERLMAQPENKLMALCNPQNPIGRVWREDELKEVARLAEKYGVYVYSDEIFAEICFDGVTPVYSLLGGNGISATSLGKTFGFTGTNQANMIIPDEKVRKAFLKQRKKDHFGSIDPLLHAAIKGAYCPEGAEWNRAQLAYLKKNIEYITAFMAEKLPQVVISPCQGAYVLWMDWRFAGMGEEELMDFFARECLFVPDKGTNYGRNHGGFIRMNVSSPLADIKAALDRIYEGCKRCGLAK